MEQAFSPLDEELELLPGLLSPALAESVGRLGAALPFGQARVLLEQLAGARVSEATVRRCTLGLGAAAVAVETGAVDVLEEGTTEPIEGPPQLQLSVDGAMVPLVGGVWAEVRTVAIGELKPGQDEKLQATEQSYFSRLNDHATFTRLATLETHRRGVAQAGQVVTVNDGAEWIQTFIDTHAPGATRVLDLGHASGYVHAAGHALAGGCGPWCEAQMGELVKGDPARVLETLAAKEDSLGAEDPAREVVAHSHAYLARREAQIQYASFQAAGLPIGSGTVESANKFLVEARCKGAGMHWQSDNVNPILALRCADNSAHWTTTATTAQEHLRLAHAQRRHERHRARRHPPRPPRPKRIVNGRPTDDHPLKRYPAVSRRRHAKS